MDGRREILLNLNRPVLGKRLRQGENWRLTDYQCEGMSVFICIEYGRGSHRLVHRPARRKAEFILHRADLTIWRSHLQRAVHSLPGHNQRIGERKVDSDVARQLYQPLKLLLPMREQS